MIHGLRNNNSGALGKFMLARQALERVGYRNPVIGYSYDANVYNAHVPSREFEALLVGQKIARKNGRNLSRFILDFRKSAPGVSVRLMGHSLGSQVILHCLENLASDEGLKGIVESVHFFGSSIEAGYISAGHRRLIQRLVSSRIVNYFSPSDEVLRHAHESGQLKNPIGYTGYAPFRKYVQRRVRPANHRFASYADTIKSFP